VNGVDLVAHECRNCHGSVERELVAIYPASEVCLDCMPQLELQRLQEELNQVQVLDRALLPEPPRIPGWRCGPRLLVPRLPARLPKARPPDL